MQDVMRDYNDQCEPLKIAKAEITRLKNYGCTLKGQLQREREEHDGARERQEVKVSLLVEEIEKMMRKHNELMQTHKATLEKNQDLTKQLGEKEKQIEELESDKERFAVKKCKLLEKEAQLRKLSDIHYNSTLELDHALQVVLESKKVSEDFKKKIKEVKVEIEMRKNATWPL